MKKGKFFLCVIVGVFLGQLAYSLFMGKEIDWVLFVVGCISCVIGAAVVRMLKE
ncbi:hypothetical protein FIU87_03550 [Bacillus sp. THAF10]|uniref:hypothetical protein n=1 Tax=Bacillus sp. THAF10 TaxID=2587848 RepID=UPI0012A9E6D8|nr:hypothetical protein [Bacillus sp. THAF10]QFT87718.1 hypothetical protein FIU87_03550 [Bacillus sp. THAF10]